MVCGKLETVWVYPSLLLGKKVFFVAGMLFVLLLGAPPQGRAADECGTTFAERYAAYSTSLTYTTNSIVTTGTRGGGDLQLWLWGATVTPGDPPPATGNTRGWQDVTTRHASRTVDCDSGDAGLGTSTDISYAQNDLAVIYNYTATPVRSIAITGAGSEIHLLGGSILYADDATASTHRVTVSATSNSTDLLRVITRDGFSVVNQDESANSRGISVVNSGGDVQLDIAGDTRSARTAIYAEAGAAGDVYVNISGGHHRVTNSGSALHAVIATGGTGDININVTGPTVLEDSNTAGAALWAAGGTGSDTITVGAGAVICAGTWSSGVCTRTPGVNAILLEKTGGTGIINNSGNVYGDIRIEGATSFGLTVTNQSGGTILGGFHSDNGGNATVDNAGTWTLTSAQFGTGTDSFTNTGTLVIQHSGSTQNVTALETFALRSAGTTRFVLTSGSRAHPVVPLLHLDQAVPTLAGTIEYNASIVPTSGDVILMTGQRLTADVSIANLALSSDITNDAPGAALSISGNNLILDFGNPCGALTERTVSPPGRANRQLVCTTAQPLTETTDVITKIGDDRIAIIFRGGTTIRSINNRGIMGEVYLLSGSVVHPNDSSDTPYAGVRMGPPIDPLESPDTATLQEARAALANTRAEGTPGRPGYLTAAQVFARANTIRLATNSGTVVNNRDTSPNNYAVAAYGLGGDVLMDIVGSTAVRGTNSRGIFPVTSAAGDIRLNIAGGTHTAIGTGARTVHAWLKPSPFDQAPLSVRPTGSIVITIRGSARISASDEDSDSLTVPLFVNPEWSYTTAAVAPPDSTLHTVEIGPGVVLCRGAFNDVGQCEQQGDHYAIRVANTGAALTEQSGPAFQIVNQGTLYGGINSIWNARGTRIINRGAIHGSFVSGSACVPDATRPNECETDWGVGHADGPDEVTNEEAALWVMRKSSVFRNEDDSFTNKGTLVLRHSGTQLALSGLNAFNQATSATLRIEIDPRRFTDDGADRDSLPDPIAPELPDSPLVDFDNAQGFVEGVLQVIILDTFGLHGGLTLEELGQLLATVAGDPRINLFANADSLTFRASLGLSSGITRDRATANTLFYDLEDLTVGFPLDARPTAGPAPGLVAAHTYDSVIQTSWFASRALLDYMNSAQCNQVSFRRGAAVNFFRDACMWGDIGTRVFTHSRSTPGLEESEEITFGIKGGVQMPLGDVWALNAAVVYEYARMDIGAGESQGHRTMAGAMVSTDRGRGMSRRYKEPPLNFSFGGMMGGGFYEVERTVDGRNTKGEPEVFMVGAHAGMAYSVSQGFGILGAWTVTPTLSMDFLGLVIEDFSEDLPGTSGVGKVQEIMVTFTPLVDIRRVDPASWGWLESWVEVGITLFATDPELDYRITIDRTTTRFEGTMEPAMLDLSIGFDVALSASGSGFSLFWDGMLGNDTMSNAVSLKVKYVF